MMIFTVPLPQIALPFPQLPSVQLDGPHTGYGLAQALCREQKAQGRLLWIDATANMERVNTAEKIVALVAKIKAVGFNTVVFDVKPIVGETLYPSKLAPKLTEWVRPWATYKLPADFDPLKVMSEQCRKQNLSLIVAFNAFSEGHREFPKRGLAVERPQWQTVLYENAVAVEGNVLGESLQVLQDTSKLPKLNPESFSVALDKDGKLVALFEGSSLAALTPKPSEGGAFLVALGGKEASWLRSKKLGEALLPTSTPRFVKLGELAQRQVPLMTNPHHPEVRKRLLDILAEVAGGYDIDGVIFDDRLRYAALNADFSDLARQDFEAFLGKPVESWPLDIFRWEVAWPDLSRRWPVPGPLYEPWLTFRAQTLKRFVADAAKTVKAIKPQLKFATYVGSWYPDYPELGANWAADDLQAGLHFLSDSYRSAGWAGLTDFMVTGCYYKIPTLRDALAQGRNIGDTVEAAGQFSNRAVGDATFVYAGISLEHYKNRPEELKRTLQAACATTQGIMCFDLSHDIEPLWPLFMEAFKNSAPAPHTVPGLLTELHRRRAAQKASGKPEPPVILYRGTSGTGF
jgi:uncharacterized lipoprotein YddW (UPF0748 family)